MEVEHRVHHLPYPAREDSADLRAASYGTRRYEVAAVDPAGGCGVTPKSGRDGGAGNIESGSELSHRGDTADTLTVEGTLDRAALRPPDVAIGTASSSRVRSRRRTAGRRRRAFSPMGAGSFADGDMTYDGICEVCHTQTRTFAMTAASGPAPWECGGVRKGRTA